MTTTTTATKYTYVNALDEVLALDCISAEAREKLTQLKEQTAKRNTSHSSKPTAKQVANGELAEQVYNTLLSHGEPMTVSDIIHANADLIVYSTQKISAICKLLEGTGKVAKATEKRKTYFSAVTEA
jgi:hypothetical protein